MQASVGAFAKPSPKSAGVTVSTADVAACDRREWLQEVIGREYTRVELQPPDDAELFNQITFYEWDRLRLSTVRSHGLTICRPAHEPYLDSQDNYLGVMLLSGHYLLEQNGREACLGPGDMAIYDATRPHRIRCSGAFSKLIVTIPRAMMRDRLTGVEHCTALRIPGEQGVGAVAAGFIRSVVNQAGTMETGAFSALSEHALDLLTMALASVRPQNFSLSRSRSISLLRVKDFVESHLADPELNTDMVSAGTGYSQRYINDLYRDEPLSLMRYVWQRRLENCLRDMRDPRYAGRSVSEIALRWGFNDLSHFSRAFRKWFGCAPRDARQ